MTKKDKVIRKGVDLTEFILPTDGSISKPKKKPIQAGDSAYINITPNSTNIIKNKKTKLRRQIMNKETQLPSQEFDRYRQTHPSAKEIEIVDTAFNEELFYLEDPKSINPADEELS